MKLDKQCCSLELAKKLKELGVKQESLFYWSLDKEKQDCPLIVWNLKHRGCANQANLYDCSIKFPEYYDLYSAFTVAELGEMLPYEIWDQSLIITKCYSCWEIKYQEGYYPYEKSLARLVDDTEANARAKMLIYLLENKLI